jgi:hypothetical protein
MADARFNADVRGIVDPLLLKLRNELFVGPYTGQLSPTVIPVTTINEITEQVINNYVETEGLAKEWQTFTVGSSSVSAHRVVYFSSGIIQHADCTNIAHAGHVIGYTLDAGAAGASVRVQSAGVVNLGLDTLPVSTGPLFLDTAGTISATLNGSAVFVQHIGTAIASNKLLVSIDPTIVVL